MAALKFAPPQLAAPFARLLAHLIGAGHHVWIVGGWVRDAARGERPHDADFCTDADGAAIEAAAKASGATIALDRVAQVHGTYRLVAQGTALDLARLRRDVARVGARHAQVTFTDVLAEDLARRDLTINALALPYPLPARGAAKTLVDAHGGLADLADQRLRLIGTPAARLEEDPLRLLRIARFACLSEDWTIDAPTLDAMVQRAPAVGTVSVERRLGELMRALELPAPARFFQTVATCGAQASLFGEHLQPAALQAGTALLARVAPLTASPQLRLAAFVLGTQLPDAPYLPPAPGAPPTKLSAGHLRARTVTLLGPLRFPRAWQEMCAQLVAACAPPSLGGEPTDVARWAIGLGAAAYEATGELAKALAAAEFVPAAALVEQWQRAEKLRRKRALWRGQDLALDAAHLFATLEVGEGALRRWLLGELLVHAWVEPKANEQAALTRVARTLLPTEVRK